MKQQLVREMVGGEWIEVAGILERLAAGHAIEALITDSRGRLSREAIAEATTLAQKL